MEIKQYDIVEYKGEPCRVMNTESQTFIKISPHGWVPIDEVHLVESVTVPIFGIGDSICINNIDQRDRDEYSATWLHSMDKLVNTASTIVDFDENEGIYLLANSFWFVPYHLEKVDRYDMI